jgi:hypothetical protein
MGSASSMGFVSRAPKAALEDVRPVEDLRDGGDDLDDLRERVAGLEASVTEGEKEPLTRGRRWIGSPGVPPSRSVKLARRGRRWVEATRRWVEATGRAGSRPRGVGYRTQSSRNSCRPRNDSRDG